MNISNDVLEPLVFERYDVSGQTKLNVGRAITAGFIIISLLWAFEFPGLQEMYFFSSALISATAAVALGAVFSKKTTTLSAYLSIGMGTVGTFGFYFLEKAGMMGFIPEWIIASGLAYGLLGILMAVAGIFLGIRYGDPPSERVLARYDGEYYSGRRERYEMNQRMKEEEREDREESVAV